jgi:hypothetical protein
VPPGYTLAEDQRNMENKNKINNKENSKAK